MSDDGLSIIFPYELPRWVFPVAVGAVGVLILSILVQNAQNQKNPPAPSGQLLPKK